MYVRGGENMWKATAHPTASVLLQSQQIRKNVWPSSHIWPLKWSNKTLRETGKALVTCTYKGGWLILVLWVFGLSGFVEGGAAGSSIKAQICFLHRPPDLGGRRLKKMKNLCLTMTCCPQSNVHEYYLYSLLDTCVELRLQMFSFLQPFHPISGTNNFCFFLK